MAGVTKAELELMKKFNKYEEETSKEIRILKGALETVQEDLNEQRQQTKHAMQLASKLAETEKRFHKLQQEAVDMAEDAVKYKNSLSRVEKEREATESKLTVRFLI